MVRCTPAPYLTLTVPSRTVWTGHPAKVGFEVIPLVDEEKQQYGWDSEDGDYEQVAELSGSLSAEFAPNAFATFGAAAPATAATQPSAKTLAHVYNSYD